MYSDAREEKTKGTKEKPIDINFILNAKIAGLAGVP